jgi:Spy/CpxP family protein refolding chaperone
MAHLRRLVLTVPALSALALAASLCVSCKDKAADTTGTDAAPSTMMDAAVALPAASTPMPASSADGGGGPDDREAHRGDHGGPSVMLFQAARALDLNDEQKAKIDAAEKTAHAGASDASRDALKTATKDLHDDLVAGIKAGKVDTSKLEPRYVALEKIAGETHAREADALNALHAALDTTQRKAVTANVRAKQAAREAKMAHRDGADGGVARDGGGPDGGKGIWTSKHSVDRLTRGLDLDADQQKKVDALVAKEDAMKTARPDPADIKKNVEAMLVAFEKDTFDAKKLDAFDAKKVRAPMEQETHLLVGLVPILKPEQREKLVAKMEKGASPHGGRGPGFRPRPMLEEGDDD